MSIESQHELPQQSPGGELEPEMPRVELRQAILHVVITVGIAALFVAGSAVTSGAWFKVLILGSAAVIFLGAVVLGVRAFRSQRSGGRWQVYQGGMWALLLIFLLWVFGAIGAAMA
ncbi:hypothetical protein [Gordonia alkaliphila]|uniref:Uncharacterized protein n=1 Tax=Gordonia alkaliphila TaxID=1053547 RepID=A0ABP8YVC5_9ACTN